MVSDTVWLKLTLKTTPETSEEDALLLTDLGSGGVEEVDDALIVYFSPEERKTVERALGKNGLSGRYAWETIGEENWRDKWKEHFKPELLSPRLAVCPSWEEWAPHSPQIRTIRIDPGRAFGTGTHETTLLCLGLIDDLCGESPPEAMLDVGCGSGILTIGALLLGVGRSVAFDVDPIAAAVTRENVDGNEVGDRALVMAGDVRSVKGGYQLVVANIFYQILVGIAPQLWERTAYGGTMILSGALASELDPLSDIFSKLGFRETDRRVLGEWGALAMEKPGPAG